MALHSATSFLRWVLMFPKLIYPMLEKPCFLQGKCRSVTLVPILNPLSVLAGTEMTWIPALFLCLGLNFTVGQSWLLVYMFKFEAKMLCFKERKTC